MAKSGDKIFGRCLPKFAGVEQAFRQNFADGWEREGASVAIFWQGQLVVDLHGGYADRSAQAEWTEATRTVLFSATKAVAALAVHMVVEQRGASYSDAVTKYWPEFGQHGKAQLTVEDLLNHRAGLAALDEPVSLQDARKPDRMAAILEAQTPNWTPGTQSGYHAVTFGWLLDQLVRRMDKQGRSLSEFVRQEITDKHAIDFHLGLPLTEAHTVSRLTMPSWSFKLREVMHDPRVLIVLAILHLRTQNSLRSKIARNPPWIRLDSQFCTPNNPELYTIEQAGALGIGRARDLARIFALMLTGQFISPATLERISRPQLVHHRDFVLMVPVSKGNGFMYEPHPRKPGKWLFGHPGFGGTSVMVEPEEQLVIAYVSNGLKTGMGELAGTYRRLRNAALEAVDFD